MHQLFKYIRLKYRNLNLSCWKVFTTHENFWLTGILLKSPFFSDDLASSKFVCFQPYFFIHRNSIIASQKGLGGYFLDMIASLSSRNQISTLFFEREKVLWVIYNGVPAVGRLKFSMALKKLQKMQVWGRASLGKGQFGEVPVVGSYFVGGKIYFFNHLITK